LNKAPQEYLLADATSVHIDTASIPDHVRDDLAAATLDFIHGILQRPGGREALDAKIAAKQKVRA